MTSIRAIPIIQWTSDGQPIAIARKRNTQPTLVSGTFAVQVCTDLHPTILPCIILKHTHVTSVRAAIVVRLSTYRHPPAVA